MKTMHVMIARVDGPVFDAPAQSVTLPGNDGELTILPTHEPFITPLKEGTIVVKREDGEVESFPVVEGTVEVSSNNVSILI